MTSPRGSSIGYQGQMINNPSGLDQMPQPRPLERHEEIDIGRVDELHQQIMKQ